MMASSRDNPPSVRCFSTVSSRLKSRGPSRRLEITVGSDAAAGDVSPSIFLSSSSKARDRRRRRSAVTFQNDRGEHMKVHILHRFEGSATDLHQRQKKRQDWQLSAAIQSQTRNWKCANHQCVCSKKLRILQLMTQSFCHCPQLSCPTAWKNKTASPFAGRAGALGSVALHLPRQTIPIGHH
jgi:hypothetical protein